MERFGTLESSFNEECSDWLFASIGFVDVVRYHGINGLFFKAIVSARFKIPRKALFQQPMFWIKRNSRW
jgi:hypothetical protein